jgi:hypothetical protein
MFYLKVMDVNIFLSEYLPVTMPNRFALQYGNRRFFKGTINTVHILFWIKTGGCDLAEKLFLDSFVSHLLHFITAPNAYLGPWQRKTTIFFYLGTYVLNSSGDSVSILKSP